MTQSNHSLTGTVTRNSAEAELTRTDGKHDTFHRNSSQLQNRYASVLHAVTNPPPTDQCFRCRFLLRTLWGYGLGTWLLPPPSPPFPSPPFSVLHRRFPHRHRQPYGNANTTAHSPDLSGLNVRSDKEQAKEHNRRIMMTWTRGTRTLPTGSDYQIPIQNRPREHLST